MKWLSTILKLMLLFVVIAAALAGLALLQAARSRIKRQSIEGIQQREGVAVRVTHPVQRDFVEHLTCDGVVDAAVRSVLRARIGETVEAVHCDVGDTVKKGQDLVQFRTADLEADLEARRAADDEAESNLQRFEALHEAGNTSLQLLEQTRTARQAAAAALRLAESRLQFARVLSPISGVVESRHVEPEEFKDKANELLTIIDLGRIEILARVPESAIGSLEEGGQGEFRIEGDRGWNTGKIERISPFTDNPNRFFDVYLEAENRREGSRWQMRPGMYCEVRFPIRSVEAALAVPANTIRTEGQREIVLLAATSLEEVGAGQDRGQQTKAEGLWGRLTRLFVKSASDAPANPNTDKGTQGPTRQVEVLRAKMAPVRTGLRLEGFVELEEAEFSESDLIIVNPQDELRNGTKVKIVETQE